MRLLILCPIEIEYNTVSRLIANRKTEVRDGLVYQRGSFQGKVHAYDTICRRTGSKIANIALATEKAIQHYQPDLIILLGVAGGIKDVQIGDVVIGTKAYGYESGKVLNKTMVARPEVLSYDPDLIELARDLARSTDWQKVLGNKLSTIRVVFGPIASGDKVIASTDTPLYHFLKQFYNDTIAIEMEAFGFAKATVAYPNIRIMNIRGISDLLDNKAQADLKGSQELAIEHAAAFAFAFLHQLDYSLLKIYTLDPRELAKKISSIIFPLLEQKAYNSSKDFSNLDQQIWRLVQHLFQEEIADLKESPNDKEIKLETVVTVKRKLRKTFKNDRFLYQELSNLVEKVETHPTQNNMTITRGKNIIQGSQINVGGNVQLGDSPSLPNQE